MWRVYLMYNCFIKLFPSFKQQTCGVVVVLCSTLRHWVRVHDCRVHPRLARCRACRCSARNALPTCTSLPRVTRQQPFIIYNARFCIEVKLQGLSHAIRASSTFISLIALYYGSFIFVIFQSISQPICFCLT